MFLTSHKIDFDNAVFKRYVLDATAFAERCEKTDLIRRVARRLYGRLAYRRLVTLGIGKIYVRLEQVVHIRRKGRHLRTVGYDRPVSLKPFDVDRDFGIFVVDYDILPVFVVYSRRVVVLVPVIIMECMTFPFGNAAARFGYRSGFGIRCVDFIFNALRACLVSDVDCKNIVLRPFGDKIQNGIFRSAFTFGEIPRFFGEVEFTLRVLHGFAVIVDLCDVPVIDVTARQRRNIDFDASGFIIGESGI